MRVSIISVAAIVAGVAAAASAQQFFGFDHAATGQAQLSPNASGHLVVSNIGSSGKDGVSIDMGETDIMYLEVSLGPAGAMDPGSKTQIYVPVEGFSHEECVEVCEDGTGNATLGYVSIGFEPRCVTVSLFDGGMLVDTREFLPPYNGPLVSGALGDDPGTGQAPSLFATKKGYDYYQARSDMAIVGSPTGSVQADQVRVEREVFRQDFGPVQGTRRVAFSNRPGGAVISAEALLFENTAGGGNVFDNLSRPISATGLGAATLQGVCDINICAGCPECCDPMPAEQACGLSVDNLGSSGQDGVRFSSSANGFFDIWPEVRLATSPIDLPDLQDALRCAATGVHDGLPRTDLGSITLSRDVDTLLLEADFSPVGGTQATIEVYNDGVLAGSYTTQAGPGIPVATIQPAAGGLGLNKCGKLGGSVGPPCFFACTDDDFTLFGNGQVLVGDDLRVLAANTPNLYGGLESFDVVGTSIDLFLARVMTTDSSVSPPVLVDGLVHAPLGAAQLSTGADGALVVSNLGSSGQDGVSIDIGSGQGGSYELGDTGYRLSGPPDVFFDIILRASDGSTIGQTHYAAVDATSATMAVDFQNPALSLNVALIDSDNDLIHAAQIPNGSLMTLTNNAGLPVAAKKVVKFKAGADLAKKVNMAEPVDVTLTSGTFAGVARIVVTATDPNAALKKGDRVALVGFGSFSVSKSRVMQFGNGHSALGAARVAGVACDAVDTDDHASIVGDLFVSNLGSSGQDGVSISFDDFDDNDSDDDDLPDLLPAGGIQMTTQQNCDDSCEPIGLCWSLEYRDDLGDLGTSDVCFNPLANGDVSVDVGPIRWMAPESIRVRAIDQNGQVVGEVSGLMPGPVATIRSTGLRQLLSPRGQYATDRRFYPRRNAAPPPPGLIEVESAATVITTGAPMLVELAGSPAPVSAVTLEIGMRNANGDTPAISGLSKADAKRALDPGAATQGSSGGPVSLFIEQERIVAFAPACHADCAPVNPDGTVGNGIINVDDLFGVINAISTQDHRCDIAPDNGDGTAGNLTVNFDDILKVIADFGPCP